MGLGALVVLCAPIVGVISQQVHGPDWCDPVIIALVCGVATLLLAWRGHLRTGSLAAWLLFATAPAVGAWQQQSVGVLLFAWAPVYPMVMAAVAGTRWGLSTGLVMLVQLVVFGLLFPGDLVLGEVRLPAEAAVASACAITLITTTVPILLRSAIEERDGLRDLLDWSNDAIWIIDPVKTTVVWCNRTAEEDLGYGPMAGRSLWSFATPDDEEPSLEALSKLVAGGVVLGRHRRADGTSFPVEINVKAAFRGVRPVLIAVARDITELRRHEAELEALNAELEERVRERTRQILRQEAQLRRSERLGTVGQMAGSVAHDFNNLLAVVSYASQELDQVVDVEGAEALADIRAATRQGVTLTRGLLDFSRRVPTRPRALDPVAVVSELVPLARRVLRGGANVELDLVAGAPPVYIDPGALERALLNLVKNAGHSGADLITVRVLPAGEGTEIRVIDDGEGMRPDVVARCMEPFYSTRRPGEGTGLGLASVLGVMRGAEGEVLVESRLGEGTTITLSFPPAPEETRSAALGSTVLLVDDDDGVRESLTMALARAGYAVKACVAGDQALEILSSSERIDVLVTDWLMPTHDGAWLLRRAAELRPELPSVVMTGWPEPSQPSGTLIKPFKPSELVARVKALTA